MYSHVADPSKYPTDPFLKGGYLRETRWNKLYPPKNLLSDKLRRGRFLTDTETNNELRDRYIIAEDRPPQDVLDRIDDLLIDCNDKKSIYHFKVPYQQGIEYEELLRTLCVLGGKRTYSVSSTNHDDREAEDAYIIYEIIMEIQRLLLAGQFRNLRDLWYTFNKRFRVGEDKFYDLVNKICMML